MRQSQTHFDRDVQAQLSFFSNSPAPHQLTAWTMPRLQVGIITPSSRRLTDILGIGNLGPQT